MKTRGKSILNFFLQITSKILISGQADRNSSTSEDDNYDAILFDKQIYMF